jgi:hypothetical protein
MSNNDVIKVSGKEFLQDAAHSEGPGCVERRLRRRNLGHLGRGRDIVALKLEALRNVGCVYVAAGGHFRSCDQSQPLELVWGRQEPGNGSMQSNPGVGGGMGGSFDNADSTGWGTRLAGAVRSQTPSRRRAFRCGKSG